MLDPQTLELLRQLGVDPASLEALLASAAILTIVMLATAVPTVIIAKRKSRSRGLWLQFALSVPVLPLLLVWMLPSLPPDPKKKP